MPRMLERAHDGGAGKNCAFVGAENLEGARAQAASGREPLKLSRDPNFVAKVEAFVGLYLNPPEHALVLSVDEKSQIQALDRTQPGLPMKKGRCGTMTHDYKRNGTTTFVRRVQHARRYRHRPIPHASSSAP